MVRTNIAVDDTVANALSTEAKSENKTLYSLANEVLGEVLKVLGESGEASEIYPSWRFLRVLKDLDSIPIPGDLLEKMIKKLYEDEEWILNAWFEEGARLGQYLKLSAPRVDDLVEVVRELGYLLPLKRLQIEKPLDSAGSSQLVMKLVGAGLSEESTNCAAKLVEGILSAYSLHITSVSKTEGILEIVAE